MQEAIMTLSPSKKPCTNRRLLVQTLTDVIEPVVIRQFELECGDESNLNKKRFSWSFWTNKKLMERKQRFSFGYFTKSLRLSVDRMMEDFKLVVLEKKEFEFEIRKIFCTS